MNKLNFKRSEDTELTIKDILNFGKRNINLIVKILGITISLSTIYAFSAQKIWKGEFQILLRDDKSTTVSKLLEVDPTILNLLGVNEEGNLNTEVEILKSPSVLFDNFSFVKRSKIAKGKKLNAWKYSDWLKSNLNIELRKGTSVLNVSYKDSDKELIIPVLEGITKSYQRYSSKDRIKNLNNAIEYLDNQIQKYEFISQNSLSNAEKFAIDNDLIGLTTMKSDMNNLKTFDSEKNNIFNPTEFGTIRVSAASEIRRYDEILKKLSEISDDEEFYAFAKIVYKEKSNEFELIDKNFEYLQNIYKANDPSIINLKRRKSNFVKQLRIDIPLYYKALKKDKETIVMAAKRPKDLLIKYQNLMRKASRDNVIYETLQNQSRIINLEKQKISDPWQLITNPTLFPNPVEPSKKRIVFLGGFFGIILSFLVAYYKEKNQGIIFNENNLTSYLGLGEIINFSDLLVNDGFEEIKLLVRSFYNKFNQEKLSIIFLGDIEQESIIKLKDLLNKDVQEGFIEFYNGFSFKENYSHIILITSLGKITQKEIEKFNKNIQIKGSQVKCCISI